VTTRASTTKFVWIDDAVVEAIHDAQLAEHGGLAHVLDTDMLAAALARPKNLAAFEKADVCRCAAAYGHAIARNRPFVDGNLRTAFVAVELFLELNGYSLETSDTDCVLTMLGVCDGSIDEALFPAWLRRHIQPHAQG
jgi:death-on-curing protein